MIFFAFQLQSRRNVVTCKLSPAQECLVEHVRFIQSSIDDNHVRSISDLWHRIGSHENGEVLSTRTCLPATMKSYVAVSTETNARQFERYFQSGSGNAFATKRFW